MQMDLLGPGQWSSTLAVPFRSRTAFEGDGDDSVESVDELSSSQPLNILLNHKSCFSTQLDTEVED